MSHGSHNSHASHNNHTNHGDHANRYNPVDYLAPWDGGSHEEIGGAATVPESTAPFTVNHPAPLSWSTWPTNDIVEGSYVASAEDKIKELRNKVQALANQKVYVSTDSSVQGASTSNFPPVAMDISANIGKAADGTFDAADPVDDAQYDGIRDGLEQVHVGVTGSGAGLPVVDNGSYLNDADVEAIKTKIDYLAAYDAKAKHGNHYNTHSSTNTHNNY